ncbi:MAG: alpha-amylase [Ignavibacteria bacterium]|jgi:glycosidase|nr:alpha-amylase [Ignavibacteria bacterium]MCU7503987.1 alpha-amylase [Ignavibacteria bacterium]MCU7515359.1 alpha-amylase [Ignavibacteria bacterium]
MQKKDGILNIPVCLMEGGLPEKIHTLQRGFEFHISKRVRDKYKFDESIFSFNGNVIFANFHASRVFAQKLNENRKPENFLRAGQINAMGLLDEIYHYVLRQYELKANPEVFRRALEFVRKNSGEEELKRTLLSFVRQFPPMEVYKDHQDPEEYLGNYHEGKPNSEIVLEEMMLLFFANYNPANRDFKELFSDEELTVLTPYSRIINQLEDFFMGEKKYGPDDQAIFDLLRTPIIANPESLEEQLKFISNRWSIILDLRYLDKLLRGMDMIKEDARLGAFGGGGGAPTAVPRYKSGAGDLDFLTLGKSGYRYGKDAHLDFLEAERFTPDVHWMPQVVLLAKNVYVWLDQLSRKYGRHIAHLDQIPDEELDMLAGFNFTGLWLIGLWERSRASQRIKQLTGNPEAVPSAYSVYDYMIAYDLGGEHAFQNLNYRCRQRGIRLASDMVPNHMGIFSKWVVEHPDYFIQTPYSPFPNYRFTGPDLSEDPSVQLRIEDGYWTKTDAAVVFQRIDNNTGEVRYIYHGNDGTNMPWNDTAQLDMLKDYVREAVIQTIFHVARKTSIIRFDAAMTLAKRHFHRLWYPQPGSGGDIPSRSDYGLRQEEFDQLFPKEFWREVVDRINEEMPDTLLLAEAFWLMEGYFVRTLGMHRVYNSAFMHMMMKEENEKYRKVISSTLEFNPEILKRYVNFMSNPDEETAIRQFGTDDKYFGVATLMVTLPGLPMFAHGQIEGYSEKYGMEYKRAYYNEFINEYLVDRHRREIFPLMKKRYMFSQVDNFWFYDFYTSDGNVNQNVFAYTNKFGDEKAIVVYNNKFSETTGWINRTTGKSVPTGNGGEERTTIYSSLAPALGLKTEDKFFYIYRDLVANLEYIRLGREMGEKGLFIHLKPFKYNVFLDFREVYDATGEYEEIWRTLNGAGVPSIEQTVIELRLSSVHEAMLNLFDNKSIELVTEIFVKEKELKDEERALKPIINQYEFFINQVKDQIQANGIVPTLTNNFRNGLYAIKSINEMLLENEIIVENEAVTNDFRNSLLLSKDSNYPRNLLIYALWLCLKDIGMLRQKEDNGVRTIELFDELYLIKPLTQVLSRLGRSSYEIDQVVKLIRVLIKNKSSLARKSGQPQTAPGEKGSTSKATEKATDNKVSSMTELEKEEREMIERLLGDEEVKSFIGVNYFEGEWYYSKENLEELGNWRLTLRIMNYMCGLEDIKDNNTTALLSYIKDSYYLNRYLKEISDSSEYKLNNLKANLTALPV